MLFVCLLLTGLSMAPHVKQFPSHMTKTSKDSAEINCSHDNPEHDRILWYKHSDQEFELMANLYDTLPNIEPIYESKIKVDGNAIRESTLTIRNLSSADSGLYFCALRRAQWRTHHHCLTNTSAHLPITI